MMDQALFDALRRLNDAAYEATHMAARRRDPVARWLRDLAAETDRLVDAAAAHIPEERK